MTPGKKPNEKPQKKYEMSPLSYLISMLKDKPNMGNAFRIDTYGAYAQFCDSFPFEETEDQANAIKAVIDDMHPAVRLWID